MTDNIEQTNFFFNDSFYPDINELMIDLEIDETNIDEQPDFITCFASSREPIIQLSVGWIMERIDGERFTEDGEPGEKVANILKQIDFKKINEEMPCLYYESRKKFQITKEDLRANL